MTSSAKLYEFEQEMSIKAVAPPPHPQGLSNWVCQRSGVFGVIVELTVPIFITTELLSDLTVLLALFDR